ncbi:transglutaminase-like cysteine peptidase [Paenacidovorax monticola]|uniref:transglutaminase-like cysteine peptidase n=1 Tax=Paenacidovorax monticola TaxID=1926868 RepID=UPI001FE361FF|nr:transglutaminase-like cysteine peptidase [Paenacidovorax monticola]
MLACVVLLPWALAATDLDKTQSLAQERYGSAAAETVAAWRRLINEGAHLSEPDKLARVNDFFNQRILFESDMTIWQQNDYWATPLETMGRGAGDCEDFSIAKYTTLLLMGVPNERLRLIYVRARIGGASSTKSEAHMVLGYYQQPTDEPQVLDNLIGSIRPASSRPDLTPVFSFNSSGLWASGTTARWAIPRCACPAGATCSSACERTACDANTSFQGSAA